MSTYRNAFLEFYIKKGPHHYTTAATMLIWNVDTVVAEENQMAEKMTIKYVGANTQINPL